MFYHFSVVNAYWNCFHVYVHQFAFEFAFNLHCMFVWAQSYPVLNSSVTVTRTKYENMLYITLYTVFESDTVKLVLRDHLLDQAKVTT